MERMISKMITPLSTRLRLAISRAIIRLVDDSLKEQRVQLDILAGETRFAERYQHYGFTSHPHKDSEAIVLSINGSRDHLVVVADGDRRYRLKNLADGEVAIYDDQGQCVHLKRDGIYIISSQKLMVSSPNTEFTGNVNVNGSLQASSVADQAGTMQVMRTTYNGHHHDTATPPTPGM